jgi:VIT family.
MAKPARKGLIKAFIGFTGPELATQEVLYGFVMALIFITSAQVGLISYDSPWDIVILIVGMNFVWGFIDMYIFYKMDTTAQKRYTELFRNDKRRTEEERYNEVYDSLGSTIFDVLTEEDKTKAAKMILNCRLGTEKEMKADRKNMFISAASCFVITLLTTIPLILCLVLIPDPGDALPAATLVACICLFFVGYMLEPTNGRWQKTKTGISIAVVAYALTYFATYLGG